MQIFSRHRFVVLGIFLAAVVLGAGVWYYATKVYVPAFPINRADTISSWDFKGAYTGNETLVDKAEADITHLTSLLGSGEYDDYDLYNGIANDYALEGDGENAYTYYNRAIDIHREKGLAYVNLAHLMSSIGANYTAADAFARATEAEPGMLEYHLQRLTFLTERFATDNARILEAFTAASNQFGDNASILAIEAQWLTGQKRYADAIKAWEVAKMLSSKDRQAAIQAEIDALKKKQ